MKLPFLYLKMASASAFKRFDLTLVCKYIYVLWDVCVFACVHVCVVETLCELSSH